MTPQTTLTSHLRRHLLHTGEGGTTSSSISPGIIAALSRQRDQQRLVSERQPKWDANAAQLIEYYSAQGLLAEVVVDADTAAAVDKVT